MDIDRVVDSLSRTLMRDASRRGSLGLAIAFLAARLPFQATIGDAKQRKKKRRRKRKKRERPRPSSSPPCSEGACAREFASQADREYCEFICQQCDGDDPREFCIVEPDPVNPSRTAVCCAEGRACCGQECCGPDREAPGRRCCDGQCVDTGRDLLHCGQCRRRCPAGWECEAGGCVCRQNCATCPPDRAPCHGQCCPADWWCYKDKECCPEDYLPLDRVIPAPCLSTLPDQCRADSSFVCCEGFGCFVGTTDPTDWVCCGASEVPLSQRTCVRSDQSCLPGRNRYPPIATHTYGE